MLLADYDASTRVAMFALGERDEAIWTTVGIHPWAVAECDVVAELDALDGVLAARPDHVVGIGELGLDRLRPQWDEQLTVFRAQLDRARDHELPIVLHCVKAHEEVLKILAEDGVSPAGGMVHGFSGSAEQAVRYRALDIDISVGTTVTRENARKVIESIRAVGLEGLMVETDAPSRPPEKTGRVRCEPSDLIYVIDAVADVLGISSDDVALTTTDRVKRRFNLTNEAKR